MNSHGFFVGKASSSADGSYFVRFYDQLPNEVPTDSIVGKYSLARVALTFDDAKPERRTATPEERLTVTGVLEALKSNGKLTFTSEDVERASNGIAPGTVKAILYKHVRDGLLEKPSRGTFAFTNAGTPKPAATNAGSRKHR